MMSDTWTNARTSSLDRTDTFSAHGAVSAGALSAISVQITLTVLGAALGISAHSDGIHPDTEVGAAAIWWFITGLVSLFVGGAVTGYLFASPIGCVRGVNGFLTWCVVNVVGALAVILGAGAALGSSMNGVMTDNATREMTTNAALAANEVPPAQGDVAAMAWLTLAALILGALVASAASWWIGRLVHRDRTTVRTSTTTSRDFNPVSG
ncbi:MAG: hypothetical protein JNM94_05710 [Phycisphaerae bacterium]|nr:hypothetical protein [Phycisphaerae bacterium]